MTAHNPITAGQALAMVEAIGVSDARKLLADHAAAGLVKSYAMVIETAEVGKPRRSVRGSTVSLELLRRMVDEDAADDIWGGGTVRLGTSGYIGGLPEISITGFEFEEKGVVRLVDRLRRRDAEVPNRSAKPKQGIEAAQEPTSSSPPQRRRPDPCAIPPGALLATINQTIAALGLGRTKVNELMNSGRLERVEIDGGVRIKVASIRSVAQAGSRAKSHGPDS